MRVEACSILNPHFSGSEVNHESRCVACLVLTLRALARAGAAAGAAARSIRRGPDRLRWVIMSSSAKCSMILSAGGEMQLEWVELIIPRPATIDLSDYSLGNGGTIIPTASCFDRQHCRPVRCWVIGGPTSSITNICLSSTQAINFSPDFKTAGLRRRRIRLVQRQGDSITCNDHSGRRCHLRYGEYHNLIDETGAVNPPDVGAAGNRQKQ